MRERTEQGVRALEKSHPVLRLPQGPEGGRVPVGSDHLRASPESQRPIREPEEPQCSRMLTLPLPMRSLLEAAPLDSPETGGNAEPILHEPHEYLQDSSRRHFLPSGVAQWVSVNL